MQTNWADAAAEDETAMLDREFEGDNERDGAEYGLFDEPTGGPPEGYQSRDGGKGSQRRQEWHA
eukprot:5380699-Alexandrium_andersonii.AAC.1